MTSPREPGWHPDPDAPTSQLRRSDEQGWTGETRATGYTVQPGGPVPVGQAEPAESNQVFGAVPPPEVDPRGPRRRLHAAVVLTALVAVVAVVLLVLGAAGVL